MDKKTILAFVMSFAVIIIYTRFVVTPPAKQNTRGARIAEARIEPTATAFPEKKRRESSIREVRKGTAGSKLSTVQTKLMSVDFNDAGGSIARITLHRSEIIKKRPVEIVCDLERDLQPMSLSSWGGTSLDGDAIYAPSRGAVSGGEMVFAATVGQLRITKRYRIHPESFVIDAELTMENTGKESFAQDGGVEICGGAIFALTVSEGSNYIGIDKCSEQGRIGRISGGKLKPESSEQGGEKWLALRNQFFALVYKPAAGDVVGYSAREIRLAEGPNGVTARLRTPQLVLQPGGKKIISLKIYAGPKEYRALSSFGTVDVMDFGWFGFLGRWILIGLNMLYRVCGNYGVAIILLTFVIRIILYPLNQKSFRSMKEMQKIQPELSALQAKYKGDPKKSQQEMMRLYREHGINPMGGCLPLIIQMPILIAFFRVLQNAIELWGAPFCLWMKDLSEPDALFRFSTGKSALPFIGSVVDGQAYVYLNVLPILMLGVFYIQQKMSTPGMAATPEQQQQQKLMNAMMPIMFGVIFYNMPAGLNLYFAASTLLGIIQQKYMIK